MNEVVIPKIGEQVADAADVSVLFDTYCVEQHPIDVVNWSEYPYRPAVSFRIAHNGGNILLNFKVDEDDIRAVNDKDNGSVWCDSCVEFFVNFGGDYYNIESNCIGIILIGMGEERENRQRLGNDILSQVKRWSSLGTKAIGEADNKSGKWEVSLIIPKSIFVNDPITDFGGMVARGNFYKCGDDLKEPHFLSWNRIDFAKPNFHLPQFFGKLKFA